MNCANCDVHCHPGVDPIYNRHFCSKACEEAFKEEHDIKGEITTFNGRIANAPIRLSSKFGVSFTNKKLSFKEKLSKKEKVRYEEKYSHEQFLRKCMESFWERLSAITKEQQLIQALREEGKNNV